MSDPEILRPDEKDSSDDQPTRGPNLTLLYSLIALALAVAIGIGDDDCVAVLQESLGCRISDRSG